MGLQDAILRICRITVAITIRNGAEILLLCTLTWTTMSKINQFCFPFEVFEEMKQKHASEQTVKVKIGTFNHKSGLKCRALTSENPKLVILTRVIWHLGKHKIKVHRFLEQISCQDKDNHQMMWKSPPWRLFFKEFCYSKIGNFPLSRFQRKWNNGNIFTIPSLWVLFIQFSDEFFIKLFPNQVI